MRIVNHNGHGSITDVRPIAALRAKDTVSTVTHGILELDDGSEDAKPQKLSPSCVFGLIGGGASIPLVIELLVRVFGR